MKEINRVLKINGKILISVPFIWFDGEGQPVPECDGGREFASRDFLVRLRYPGFHVEEDEVDVVEHLVAHVGSQESRRVDAGMDPHRLGAREQLRRERRLHEHFPARHGQSAS